MKKSFYIISGYTLGILFSGAFFFSLFLLFKFSWIVGATVLLMIASLSYMLLADPDSYEDVDEDVVRPSKQRVTIIRPLHIKNAYFHECESN